MDPKTFRAWGHQIVDWMADYMESANERPIVPVIEPGDVLKQLPLSAPEQPESFDTIFADFEKLVVPNMTHWNSPGWFAYFPANASPPSILAEMLIATMGAQCMSWNTSPAATELEQRTMEWMRDLIGLPDSFVGVIQDTASTSTLVAMITARDRYEATPLADHRIYTSQHAHTSVVKAARMAGYAVNQVRLIDVDETFALRADALEQAIQNDIADGFKPVFVAATIGTTTTGAVDPVASIVSITKPLNIWLHVDGAWAGVAAMLPEAKHHFVGLGDADSLVINPHKWMMVNFDCSAYFVKDPIALQRSFSMTASYLETGEPSGRNYRDWGIQLGRRFRALKLWFVLRSYGADGLREMFRSHIEMARYFESELPKEFERVALVHFSLVCFRAQSDDETQSLFEFLNARRDVYLTSAEIDGKTIIRVAIGQYLTATADIDRLLSYIRDWQQSADA